MGFPHKDFVFELLLSIQLIREKFLDTYGHQDTELNILPLWGHVHLLATSFLKLGLFFDISYVDRSPSDRRHYLKEL